MMWWSWDRGRAEVGLLFFIDICSIIEYSIIKEIPKKMLRLFNTA